MPELVVKPKTETEARARPARPPLYRVLLLNDDYTPRDFVVGVLRLVFRLNSDQARRVMLIAHTRGLSVVAVYTRDVAETKATQATEHGRREGYPLTFQTQPESSEDGA
ncbi:ATP-dependent Clp protease adaptor ClpS [Amaricoccus sp.]|uniref:ATP-dependent Clp protease adaptor ClpS n=1 Tax=Amaricoccus sp. TaxID=1872485 RepID=UPI001B734304|nr:ATP-dependent Clp protease adaptor ClpS [Amaricoccus sp.]MBP7002237.1 ATP-dependent Clp protease adaptor ClpS [Amaricoccus sp.]